ncbi:cellulose binding domain-containing protein [Kitasatospora sp. NPDC098652]|uniref:cellulose-binding domain-containing protein n=1 Tax=Kitasatospora sp. NPDC098652 TaxID=3364095 RepID=UPI0037FDF459
MDDIGSYSTNEVAVNWNASLAWLAAFAAERRPGPVPPTASCAVAYKVDSAWSNGFTATVTVTNTGTSAVPGWTLGWSFAGDQRISNAWNATVAPSGGAVTARDFGWNGTLSPGASASFGFQATYSTANPAPARFTLNGAACT